MDNQTKRLTLGIDIGGTSIKMAVVVNEREIIWRRQLPFEAGDPQAMLTKIASAARPALLSYPAIQYVGLSMAGKVDPGKGTTQADNLRWHDVPVRDMLSKLIGLPVAIDNDGECAMLAEWKAGACRDVENVVFLTYGTGIGGGLIINGKPYRGRTHSGAELGHVITHAGGNFCNCGHRGCYETYASTGALKRMLGGRYTVKEIVEGAKAGKPELAKVFSQYIVEVGLGLASIMAVISPDVLVLGGGLSNAGSFFLHAVRAEMKKYQTWLTAPTTIVLAQSGNDAGVLGAAALVKMTYYGG